MAARNWIKSRGRRRDAGAGRRWLALFLLLTIGDTADNRGKKEEEERRESVVLELLQLAAGYGLAGSMQCLAPGLPS